MFFVYKLDTRGPAFFHSSVTNRLSHFCFTLGPMFSFLILNVSSFCRGLERVKMSLVLAPHGLKPQQVICTSDRMRSSGGSGDVKFPWSSMRSPVTSEKKAERFGNRDRDRRGRGGE